MLNSNTRPLTIEERSTRKQDTAASPWGDYRPSRLQQSLIWAARRSFLHRGKLRHQMTNIIAKMKSPIDVKFRDCRYRIDGKNNLAEYGLLLNPKFNKAEIDFLTGGLQDGGVAVDIGCNIGLYTLPMALKCGQHGRVLAIDANPGMCERLAENARLSEMPQIIPVCAAVGENDGRVDLLITKNDVAIVKVLESANGSIPMRSLLSIVNEHRIEKIDALKIDIEGFEDAALVPFFNVVSEDLLPKRIVIERGTPDGYNQGCRSLFNSNGYKLIGTTQNNDMYLRSKQS